VTATEIATKLGLPAPSVRRSLRVLLASGMVRQEKNTWAWKKDAILPEKRKVERRVLDLLRGREEPTSFLPLPIPTRIYNVPLDPCPVLPSRESFRRLRDTRPKESAPGAGARTIAPRPNPEPADIHRDDGNVRLDF